MKISNREYLQEIVALTKKLELELLNKKEQKKIRSRLNYLRQYLREHRKIKISSKFSYVQPQLIGFTKASSNPELLDVVLENIKQDLRKIETSKNKTRNKRVKAS